MDFESFTKAWDEDETPENVLEAIQLLLNNFDMSTIPGVLIVLEKDGFRVRRAALI